MASDLNTIIVVGRLAKNPETRYTGTGKAVTTFTIANNKPKRFQGGQWVEQQANFFDVTVWDKLAETCSNYLRTGRRVAVVGRLDQRRYVGADGQKRVAYTIIANKVHFLEPTPKIELPKEIPTEEPPEKVELPEIDETDYPEPFEEPETVY